MCYTEYGNHEEVSKSDCLPIAAAPTPFATFSQPTYRPHPQIQPQTFQVQQPPVQVNLHANASHYKTQPPPGSEVHKVYHHTAGRGHSTGSARGNGANKYRDARPMYSAPKS